MKFMREYFANYKPFLIFLGYFFGTYVILTVFYQLYLSRFTAPEIDHATVMVGHQSKWVAQLLNPDVQAIPHPENPYLKFIYSGKYVARIVEGCNAVSVMILFTAFVTAFAGRFKTTLAFIVFGWLVIHFLNTIRIALLAAAIYHYPEYEHFLHGVIFPLFIYGVVFMLWVLWVNKFSRYANQKR